MCTVSIDRVVIVFHFYIKIPVYYFNFDGSFLPICWAMLVSTLHSASLSLSNCEVVFQPNYLVFADDGCKIKSKRTYLICHVMYCSITCTVTLSYERVAMHFPFF